MVSASWPVFACKMPFYIRARQQDIPTPTISTVASDDEDNFITDPEQFFDELPQPFRLINKIVNEVLESAWDKISALERERELEAKRVRPPSYTPSSSLENSTNPSCICLTETEIIFLGLESSLVAIKKGTYEEITSWSPEDEVCVERIECTYHAQNEMYFLSIIDDMGFARLLIYENETFHVVCTVNELVEGAPKSNVTKFEISKDAQFCGVTLESNKVSTIDFYKLPIDNWVKEIDAGRKEYLKKTESLTTATTSDASMESEIPQVSSSEIAFPTIKFSAITLALKVNEPPPVSGISGKSPQQMLDQVNSGEVIGDGTNHVFTENALNIQKRLFEALNERDLIYAEEDLESDTHRPMLYFLKKSCIEPPVPSKTDAVFSHVGIWWTHHHNFYIYQLGKSGKTVDFKPDVVWPQSSDITFCEIANDTMLLAIGLDNGSVTLWDRHLGLLKSVVMVCHNIPITSISFLSPEAGKTHQFYQDARLLVGCGNGQISHVICDKDPKSHCVVTASTAKEDTFALIKPIPKLSQVFFLLKQDGSMVLRSTEEDGIICNLCLPDDCQFEAPFDTGCVLDPSGEILYLRGSALLSLNANNIFLFHLRSFPTLDEMRAALEDREDYEIPVKFNDVVQNLLTQRMKKQSARTDVLAARWHNLDKQLEFVLNLRETMMVAKKDQHFSRSSTPASHWSRTTSRIIRHNKHLQKA